MSSLETQAAPGGTPGPAVRRRGGRKKPLAWALALATLLVGTASFGQDAGAEAGDAVGESADADRRQPAGAAEASDARDGSPDGATQQGNAAQPAASAPARKLYVIEHLVVGVNTAPDGSGERIGQIQSGDRVDVLERQDEQMRIRLPSGAEGWVRASYLSESPPLREQLKARTDELEKLRNEKSRLEADLVMARKAAATAATAAASPPPAAHASPAADVQPDALTEAMTDTDAADTFASVDGAQPANPPLFAAEGLMPARPSWIVALAAAIAALVVGFMLGWRMLDRRIRAKYGGLRIY